MKIRELLKRKLPPMKVRELMQTRVYTCPIDETLNYAAEIMWNHDCGSVPVVNRDGNVVGVLTDRDVCIAAFTTDLPLSRASVTNAMSKTLHSCGPDDTVAYAQELMRRHQVRRIPVIDIDGKLLGILSLGDIARFLGEHPDLESEGIGCDALAETLGALSEPRHRRGRG